MSNFFSTFESFSQNFVNCHLCFLNFLPKVFVPLNFFPKVCEFAKFFASENVLSLDFFPKRWLNFGNVTTFWRKFSSGKFLTQKVTSFHKISRHKLPDCKFPYQILQTLPKVVDKSSCYTFPDRNVYAEP